MSTNNTFGGGELISHRNGKTWVFKDVPDHVKSSGGIIRQYVQNVNGDKMWYKVAGAGIGRNPETPWVVADSHCFRPLALDRRHHFMSRTQTGSSARTHYRPNSSDSSPHRS